MEYKDSGTFYGIEKYRFSGENAALQSRDVSQNVLEHVFSDWDHQIDLKLGNYLHIKVVSRKLKEGILKISFFFDVFQDFLDWKFANFFSELHSSLMESCCLSIRQSVSRQESKIFSTAFVVWHRIISIKTFYWTFPPSRLL